MTTAVIIKSPFRNHLAVKVESVNPETGGDNGYPQRVLADGESAIFYVHDGSMVKLTEVPKEEVPAHDTVPFGFGDALLALKVGLRVARAGWNGKGMWLELQRPDAGSKMTLPYIYLNYPEGSVYPLGARVPWLASQTDMLAEDWSVVA